ncbi:MAG: peptidoglycan DD-metalloendopeptidase family protein [Sphingomonadales bacterium]|nr:peptidoglycan DD-metalloendopeptidase family protein [Sphingomonadales bacterium]
MAGAQSLDDERKAMSLARAQSAAADARAIGFEAKAAAARDRGEQALAESAALASRIQATEADIAVGEARIRLIERLRADRRARLASRQEPAVRLLAALQMMARRPPALALVQPGSTQDLVHAQAVLASVLPLLEQRTAGLRREVEAARRLRADADRAVAALAASREQVKAQRARLVRLAIGHRRDAERFAASAMFEQDRAMAMGEKARDIADLMNQLGVDALQRQQLESLPGPLLRPALPGAVRPVPVDTRAKEKNRLAYRLPVVGRIVSGLGEVSGNGVRARGLTIATRPSAQVIAPNDGRIVFAGPYRGFGRIAIIDHGQGWTTLLAGMAALDVVVGDAVVQGSPIGRATVAEPKITVELRRGARPIDIAHLVG